MADDMSINEMDMAVHDQVVLKIPDKNEEQDCDFLINFLLHPYFKTKMQ
jgi:hypothetical protein